jgi:tetratricopeptide (TPR) repeat protein
MRISRNFSNANSLLILCLLVSGSSGCSAMLVRAAKNSIANPSHEAGPSRGLRILKVVPGSPAERAGLQPFDLLFRYGDFEVIDDASYFTAREAYEKQQAAGIPIQVWRAGKAIKATVAPGKLGIDSNECSTVAYKLSSVMMGLNAQQQIPEYERDHEFKDSYIPNEKILAEAKAIIDQAERDGTLTPNQILVARINMISDDASPEDQKRQADMVAKVIATQPHSYVLTLGQDHFFQDNHYRPASECFKRHLELYPDDVGVRLNLGVAYYQVGMFAEAEAAVDYVFDHQLGLSEHGYEVAFELKALGTLSRGDYARTISFAEKAFEIEPRDFFASMAMLAAAETGDLKKLEKASQMFQQALPQAFEKKKFPLAAVEALALVKSNQRPQARALVHDWKDKDRAEGRLKSYWKHYPRGADVWTNWNKLSKD